MASGHYRLETKIIGRRVKGVDKSVSVVAKTGVADALKNSSGVAQTPEDDAFWTIDFAMMNADTPTKHRNHHIPLNRKHFTRREAINTQ